tara:strand:- start:1696 stop:2070 length:375 start_codon:yes stop_codon:yes gene_type:complete
MALTAKEKRMIAEIIDRQMQLEQFIASRAHPLAGLGMRVSHADPFNSPFVLDRDERISALTAGASAGKRAGRGLRRKIKRTRKVSPYQKEFGRQFKAVKKAHPRTSVSVLMKKAHRNTKRKMRK